MANWIYNEFWSDKPGYSPKFFEDLLREARNPHAIPLSLLALVDDIPVGTVNLIENDDDKRAHLRPWLAALFVCPDYRSLGIGSELVRNILQRARKLNCSEVFLGTDNPSFYERLGASFYERASPEILIMKFKN